MKKIILLFICMSFFLYGCVNIEEKEEVKNKKANIEVVEDVIEEADTYTDLNNTPIGIYSLQGNKLIKLSNFKTNLIIEKDINTFQIYPSNEDIIYLNTGFGQSFHDEYIKYNTDGNLKLGFNIKFTLYDGRDISYNIFSPNETFNEWNYLMNYLYDDYANRGKSFYSHIETNQVTNETLYTAFKMQASYSCADINSNILFTVFTYDSEDDFLDNEYRGNSKYTLDILVEGRPY